MKRRLASLIMIMVVACFSSGCGTFMMRIVDAQAPREFIYPATCADVMMMKWFLKPDGTIINERSYLGAGLCVVDMPLSAVVDTVLLPIDLIGIYDYRTQKKRASTINNQKENNGSNHGLESTSAPPPAGTLETHP